MIKKKKREMPEFNTTALPDIIFMLLFFFMVVTVMKDPQNSITINLPEVKHVNTLKKHNAYLLISSKRNDNNEQVYYLSNKKYLDFKDFKKSLTYEVNTAEDISSLKAKIKIENSSPMKIVNQIKSELQNLSVYNVEYIIEKS